MTPMQYLLLTSSLAACDMGHLITSRPGIADKTSNALQSFDLPRALPASDTMESRIGAR